MAPTNPNKEIVNALLTWHRTHRRIFPWRETSDPYGVLVAEFFLQRTPANRVAKFYPKFLAKYPTPGKLARAPPSKLEEMARPLGLKKRMAWLVQSMKIVCQQYDGRIPDTLEELMTLRGVGEYTASAILCFGFGRDVPIVDVNVVRVLTRIFGFIKNQKTTKLIVKQIAQRLVPKNRGRDYNEGLLDLAAQICKSHPLCNDCPIRKYCNYYESVFLRLASKKSS